MVVRIFFSILLSWSPFIFKRSGKIWVWKEKSIDPVNVFTLPHLEIFDSENVKDKAGVHACGNGRGYTSMLWTNESWASGLRRYTVNDNLKPRASPAVPFVWAVISIQHSDKCYATYSQISHCCITFLSPIYWQLAIVHIYCSFTKYIRCLLHLWQERQKRELKRAERFQNTTAQMYWYSPPLQTNALSQQHSLQCCEPIQERRTGSKKV